jgi:hypothetical protein
MTHSPNTCESRTTTPTTHPRKAGRRGSRLMRLPRPSPQTRYRLENAFLLSTTLGSLAGLAYTVRLGRSF